jgi:hypothetical protein
MVFPVFLFSSALSSPLCLRIIICHAPLRAAAQWCHLLRALETADDNSATPAPLVAAGCGCMFIEYWHSLWKVVLGAHEFGRESAAPVPSRQLQRRSAQLGDWSTAGRGASVDARSHRVRIYHVELSEATRRPSSDMR